MNGNTPYKILIVDDDKFLLNMYSIKFQKEKFNVTTASDGLDALQKLKDGLVPDAIVLDILTVMANGLGKKTKISAWKRQSRGGVGIKAAQITDKTGKIVTAEIVKEDDNVLVMTSNKGQLIKIGLKDVPTLQRQTQGVILMRVKPEESVAAATVVSALDKEVAGVGLSVDEGNEVVESVTAADSDETTDSE
jgi:DNA gyrase subunit A